MDESLEIVVYAEDCRVAGRVELSADRLTDMLGREDEFVLHSATVEALADGRTLAAEDVPVSRDDVLAVHASVHVSAPPGNPSRHVYTRRYPVVVRSGPYVIRGYLHSPAAVQPEESTRRRAMLPLSDAWIEYTCSGEVRHTSVDTIIVNRDVADAIDFAADEDVAPPTV